MDTSTITESLSSTAPSLTIPSRQALSSGTPSAPIAGLPLRRVIPMDAHAVMDYAGGLTMLAVGALCCKTARARAGFNVLGLATIGLSLLTDYKLSLAKAVPIEVHEVADYGVGASLMAGPFALKLLKKEPALSAFALILGATHILSSMVTDYRARTGVTWGLPLART